MKRGTVVAAFDNEANAALGYARAFPKARTFRLATFRFGAAPAKKLRGVTVIRNFGATWRRASVGAR